MTLGIAASSSVRKASGPRSARGHISVRKTASPTARGTAISRAMTEVTSVPKINGSAPKSPLTGSHFCWIKNENPNRAQVSLELDINSHAISRTMPKMLSAQSNINPLNARSAIAELPREWRKFLTSETVEEEVEECGAALSPEAAGLEERGPGAISEIVSGFLIRISDKGAVTLVRLKPLHEQSVNALQNQAHTASVSGNCLVNQR